MTTRPLPLHWLDDATLTSFSFVHLTRVARYSLRTRDEQPLSLLVRADGVWMRKGAPAGNDGWRRPTRAEAQALLPVAVPTAGCGAFAESMYARLDTALRKI